MQKQHINIVISVFNEEAGLKAFAKQLGDALTPATQRQWNIIWVNDGSTDESQNVLEGLSFTQSHIQNTKIQFSRNYGHEAAMLAGIDHALPGPVVCMDADGQHPPATLIEIVNAFDQGVEIVLTERLERADGGRLKKWASRGFYSILNRLSNFDFEPNSSDFFLISERVAGILKDEFRERNRFIRGFIQTIGFKKTSVAFKAPERLHGESHYSFFGLMKLSFNALFSFSDKPLRLTISVSMFFILFTLIFGSYSLYVFFFEETPPGGYTSIVLFLSASFSILFITITVLSLYFEKALKEIRKRPIYLIEKVEQD